MSDVDYATASSIIKKEVPVSTFVPYQSLVTRNVVRLHSGDYLFVIRLEGAAHESADVADINGWHDQLNNFQRSIASPKVALWSHTARRHFSEYTGGDFKPGFAADLDAKYKAHVQATPGLVNQLYISIIYRPEPMKLGKLLNGLTKKSAADAAEQQLDDLLEVEDLINTSLSSLDRYVPQLLGCYEHNGHTYTEVGEFLGYLLDGAWSRCPVVRGDLSAVLPSSRPYFGKGGQMALRGPTATQYCAFIIIKEYAGVTCPGIFNELLGLPFELLVTQSFTFLSKTVAMRRMQMQRDRMINAGDMAESQIAEIEQAMDDLVSNRFVMGVHHFSLLVRADSPKQLAKNVGDAGTALSDAGFKWAREEIGLASAFWAQLPGNFEYRPRPGDVTSLNFAAFSCFHNFPVGRIRGTQWGHAVTTFRTLHGAPYYFSWHKADTGPDRLTAKVDPNHKELANTLIIGPSGEGKTLLQMFLLAQSMKFSNPEVRGGNRLTAVFFDKDQGAAVGIRALGGRYYGLKNGVKTGFAPFQMEPTPNNHVFLEKLMRRLAQTRNEDGRLGGLTTEQVKMISDGVTGVLSAEVPRHLRTMRNFLQFMQDTNDPNGLHARFSRWAGRGAPNGWLFDNDEDTLKLDDVPVVGFDVTDFLNNDETREPTIMYLFHRSDSLFDGRRVPSFFDEMGQLVKDQAFVSRIGNESVTVRKKDGFIVCGTQMPEQVLNSPIAAALVEQSATMILLPNPKATREQYVNGLKLSEREFEIIKSELLPKSRTFLVKQGGNSVVCELQLKGFTDEIAVLSSNTSTALLAERVINEVGSDPAVWLPEFQRQRIASMG